MSFSVGIPKELKPGEKRVSLTPKGTQYLHQKGTTVYIEENAGLLSGFSNREYEKAGGILVPSAQDLWNKAHLIKKVKEPIKAEFNFFTPQHIIFTFLHLVSPSAKPLILALQKAKTTAIAYETIEKDNEIPLLKPMSEVAGTLAAYYGAIFQTHIKVIAGKIQGLQAAKSAMLEAASQYPAVPDFRYHGKLLVLGGGHVGRHAAQMAARMGGEVWVSEISEAKRKQLKVILSEAKDLHVDSSASGLRMTNGGSINLVNPSEAGKYQDCLNSADLVIGAVHSVGERAPLVIGHELLKRISQQKPKIILDISIDQGGNVAESKPCDYEELVYLDSFGNLRFSVTNIPSFCGRGASLALEAASLEYTDQLAQGLDHAIQVCPELKSGINILKGEIVHRAIREAHGL